MPLPRRRWRQRKHKCEWQSHLTTGVIASILDRLYFNTCLHSADFTWMPSSVMAGIELLKYMSCTYMVLDATCVLQYDMLYFMLDWFILHIMLLHCNTIVVLGNMCWSKYVSLSSSGLRLLGSLWQCLPSLSVNHTHVSHSCSMHCGKMLASVLGHIGPNVIQQCNALQNLMPIIVWTRQNSCFGNVNVLFDCIVFCLMSVYFHLYF